MSQLGFHLGGWVRALNHHSIQQTDLSLVCWGEGRGVRLKGRQPESIAGHKLSPESWKASLRNTGIITQKSPKEQTSFLICRGHPRPGSPEAPGCKNPSPGALRTGVPTAWGAAAPFQSAQWKPGEGKLGEGGKKRKKQNCPPSLQLRKGSQFKGFAWGRRISSNCWVNKPGAEGWAQTSLY